MAKTKTSQVLAKLATAIEAKGEDVVEQVLDKLLQPPTMQTDINDYLPDSEAILYLKYGSPKEKSTLLQIAKTISKAANIDLCYVLTGKGAVEAYFCFQLLIYLGKDRINCSQKRICRLFGLKTKTSYHYARQNILQLSPKVKPLAWRHSVYVECCKRLSETARPGIPPSTK